MELSICRSSGTAMRMEYEIGVAGEVFGVPFGCGDVEGRESDCSTESISRSLIWPRGTPIVSLTRRDLPLQGVSYSEHAAAAKKQQHQYE